MTPFTLDDNAPVVANEIISTASDIVGGICDAINSQEEQKSESEISFQVGDFTMSTGGNDDDDDDDDDDGKK